MTERVNWTGLVVCKFQLKKKCSVGNKMYFKMRYVFWFIFLLPNSQKFVSTFVLEAYVGLG